MKKEIEQFLDYLRYERNASSHTVDAYCRDLSQFEIFIGERDLRLKKIDNIAVRAFMARLHELGLKKSSLARKLAAVRSFFQYCKKKGWIEDNVAKVVATPKQEKRVPSFLSEDEMAQFLDMPSGKKPLDLRDKAMLELFYATGIRVSELTGLNSGDVNLEERFVRVRGKGKKERLVPFGRSAAHSLNAYLGARLLIAEAQVREPPFFLNYTGGRITPRSVERIIRKYIRRTTVRRKISPHSLRHSFASHLLSRGADLRVIQEFLGHESLATTQKYTHIDLRKLQDVYKKSHPRS